MKLHDRIDDRLREFMLAQPMFFVATAPTATDGHLNLSPKGISGSFAVLGDHRVAYTDFTGSGAETHAHLRDNGRIVLMFCAFGGPPNIVRLHGSGRAVRRGQAEFDELAARFDGELAHGVRAIIDVEVTRVSDSCGFAVPLMEYAGDRDLLHQWSARKDEEQLARYWAEKNARSIDDLPAL